MGVSSHKTTHAMHDPAHCLTPGLFRSLKRGERKKFKLDVTHVFGDETLRFVGFEPLGADDLRLLQGLIALSGPHGMLLTSEPKSTSARQLRLALDLTFDAAEQDALIVKESLSKLLAEVGLTDSGNNIKALKSSLLRMSNVTILVAKGTRQAAFHLMSYAFDEDDGRLLVALNPRIADAVLSRVQFARIDMAEVRALQTDPARLIHQRLCGWINPGKVRRVELETICGYVWSDTANPEAMKKRRQTARRALEEIAACGWVIDEYATGKFQILRRNIPGSPS